MQDRKKLELHLKETLKHLFANWNDPNVSVVAAAIVDGDKTVYATNTLLPNGKRKHAERNAIEIFKERYGQPSENAVAIVTLSPCFMDSSVREGESCASMLQKEGIKHLYVGAMDKLQRGKLSHYTDGGIDVQVCKNRHLAQCCYMLEDLFERYLEERKKGDSWLSIKEKIPKALNPRVFFQTHFFDAQVTP